MSKEDYHFEKLTPIKNVDLAAYKEALNFVFADENKDIKNVAISGPYSAGKSSVLETYKAEYPDRKYIHISLSYFESTETEKESFNKERNANEDKKDGDSSNEVDGVVLEGKILNQLIHQSDQTKIPQSNFKLKHANSFWKPIVNTIVVVLFFVLLAYMSFFNKWSRFNTLLTDGWLKSILSVTLNEQTLLLSGLVCVGLLGVGLYKVIKAQRNRKIFKKLSIQGNEIEIFEQNDDSYFDKYLNEVLYLFENSGADVIVFEDMDRYNINQIFGKLKEINTLINNKRDEKETEPIRFFYLLRDDIFISKDRTKFFDIIIPIVPVIDGSNAYDKFIEHFKDGGLLYLFERSFLQEISLYIDDMRILKNIYNEFVVYHQRLREIELDFDKLLAIIVYKNIFPKDFSNLQLGSGFVHTLFERKESFIEQEIERITNEIIRIEEKITLSEGENLESLDELNALFIEANYQFESIAGQNVSKYKNRTDLIRAIIENPDQVYYKKGPNRQTLNVSEKIKLLENDEVYKKRKKAIERKTNGKLEALKLDRGNLLNQRSILKNNKLKDVINKNNIDQVFSVNFKNDIGDKNKFLEVKSSPYFRLIRYLVRNGYIDERYSDYMTYFYKNSISHNDKNFLLSVTDQLPKEYSYSLKDPKLVLSRLNLLDFDNVEILNFDLLCYLLETRSDNEKILTKFIEQLKRTKNLVFISEFLATEKEKDLFVEAINSLWPAIFETIQEENEFTHEQKRKYAIDTLYFSPEDDIKKNDENNVLSTFISNSPDFLEINKPNINKLISGFLIVDIKFKSIDFSDANKDLFEKVYENELYEINIEFILLILKEVYGLTESSEFNNKNYTLINSKPDEPLTKYINQNINKYMRLMLDNCNEYINDDEYVALKILNNEEVTKASKEEYISLINTQIEEIEEVQNKELWQDLLEKRVVIYSEDNILYYFQENELDSYLIEFINSNEGLLRLDSKLIIEKLGDNMVSNFFSSIVSCNDISNERYEYILNTLGKYCSPFTKTDIEEDKILILIKLKTIRMTDEILIFMRETYPNQVMPFITHNIEPYATEVINEENFVIEEILTVLDEEVEDKYKVKLLGKTSDEISILDKEYSNRIKLVILENHLDKSDLPFLLINYPNESKTVKAVINNIATEYIDSIVSEEYSISFELLLELFSSEDIEMKMKKELLATSLPNMQSDQAKQSLEILEMNKFLSLFSRKRPTFKVNKVNERILTAFDDKSWITHFKLDDKSPEVYRAFGRELK